ncbi:MAG: pentapeptide repeat-containing protein [Leptolyngbyaceae cyanobacterium SL_5_9]|nr:pentapeptide repeat-containing protein [Leptolyngbyaceae cyanobacterium SL_5_9]
MPSLSIHQEVRTVTDNDYLALIEQGIEVWNRWRQENSAVKPDLSRAYLFEADLSEADLRGCNLSRACLIGANLKGADLSGANLTGVYANGANLNAANLRDANLSDAKFSEANFVHADLTKVRAGGADFTATHWTGACLEDFRIDAATQLHKVEAEYVYLKSPQQERRPEHGAFNSVGLVELLQSLPNLPPSKSEVEESQSCVAPESDVKENRNCVAAPEPDVEESLSIVITLPGLQDTASSATGRSPLSDPSGQDIQQSLQTVLESAAIATAEDNSGLTSAKNHSTCPNLRNC